MPSMKMIKRRMASVTTTQKIMKAMNMVSASKLQKDRARLEAARPFLNEAKGIIDSLNNRDNHRDIVTNQFFEPRRVNHSAYLIITSDRGLCGSYNTNLLEEAMAHMNDGKNEIVAAVGIKGYDYFKRRGKNVLHRFSDLLETAFYEDAERITDYLASLYASGDADEVFIAYTQFDSALVHTPRIVKLLPASSSTEADDAPVSMKCEPDVVSYLDHAVPLYLSAFVFSALLESSACEHAARMLSMDTAVNNAEDIAEKLTRVYNRSRQAAITQELSEVVTSTNVLK